jgi:hypothetical protein
MRKIMIAAALMTAAAPALAQVQNGLVNVNLSSIQVQLQDILSHNNVNVTVPASISLPIGIAAQVCGINAAVLAHQKSGGCNGSVANNQTASAIAKAIQHGGQHQ